MCIRDRTATDRGELSELHAASARFGPGLSLFAVSASDRSKRRGGVAGGGGGAGDGFVF